MEDLRDSLKYLSPVLTKHTDLIIKKGKGLYIYDINDIKYIDLVQGIATNPLGHCYPAIVKAIKKQVDILIGGSFSYLNFPSTLKLLNILQEFLPRDLNTILFSNSGGEANEGAIKLAKFYTKRQGIISFLGAYHGRNYGALSATTVSSSGRSSSGSLMSDFYILPYPAENQCPMGYNKREISNYVLNEMEKLFKYVISPENVAGIIIEPLLGDGGYYVPEEYFMKKLREISKKYGILLIFDEVQSGYGRTGKMFGFEHFDISPDILTIGKPMASGLPMSALISTKEIMKNWTAGKHGGSTFTGNPVCSAAAYELLSQYKKQNLIEKSSQKGEYLKAQLLILLKKYDILKEVRGLGLMLGLEFNSYEELSSTEVYKRVREILLKNKVLVATCGLENNVLRFIPPLNITKKQIDEVIKILNKSILEFYKQVNTIS